MILLVIMFVYPPAYTFVWGTARGLARTITATAQTVLGGR
jgi:hypothetical protein